MRWGFYGKMRGKQKDDGPKPSGEKLCELPIKNRKEISSTKCVPFTDSNTAERYLPDNINDYYTGMVFFDYNYNCFMKRIGTYGGVSIATPLVVGVAGKSVPCALSSEFPFPNEARRFA